MASMHPIDLFKGWPSRDLIPADALKEAAVKALSNNVISDAGFGYGPDEGYAPLRENIAQWLTQFYDPQEAISSSRICITGGASQNLASILQVFTDPLQTKMIWLVEPTYHLVFQSFEDAGFHGRMRGIPEDESGMDVLALERALEEFTLAEDNTSSGGSYVGKPARSYRKIYKHIIYCVPSFSNPSGTTMTRSRREALVRVARRFDALVICDDVYDFLILTKAMAPQPIGTFLQRLVDIDRSLDGGPRDSFGNVISNGSFSKLLGPGCRVGWAEGSDAFIYGLSQAGQTKSGGAPSQLMSTFVNELLETNKLQQHISNTLSEGHRRYSLMVSTIRKCLKPLGVTFSPDPDQETSIGGYYVWVRLPVPLFANEVCQKALEAYNLDLGNGSLFAVPGGRAHDANLHRSLRLCFMWENDNHLVEGVSRLASVIEAMLKSEKSNL